MWRSRSVPRILNLGLRHRFSAAASVGTTVGVVLGSLALVAGCLALLVTLNHSFYALLVRRQGVSRAVVGIGLHALHHLVAAAAVPVGVVSAVRAVRARSHAARRAGGVALEPSAE